MSDEVSYPVEIRHYDVSVKRKLVEIVLDGVELNGNGSGKAGSKIRRVGVMHFDDSHPVGDQDVITLGGYLRMDRFLYLLPSALALLRDEKQVYLHRDGTLSTCLEE